MSVTTFDHIRKQADDADPLEITLTNTNAAGASVSYAIPSGADVLLTVREMGRGGAVAITDGVMTADADQTTNPGLVTYDWADVLDPGNYDFEIKVVLSDDTQIRFPRNAESPFYGTIRVIPNLEA